MSDLSKQPARSVLVIKPSSLGDVVHTLPAVHALKLARPHWKISWLVNTEWAPLLEGNPDLDEVILFPRNAFRGLSGIPRLARWLKTLNLREPELALDFQGLTRSALLARWSKACRIHCLANAELLPRLLSHHVVSVASNEHAVDRYLRMISELGMHIEKPVEFPLPAGTPACELPERYLLLHPFSRGAGKSMGPSAIQALCRQLAPFPVVLAGKNNDGFKAPENCLNLLNRTSLAQLIWLIRHAAFSVSVDSGPMHIAAAITERLLAIHTWSDPRKVGPYRPEAWVWKNADIQQVKQMQFAPGAVPFEETHVPLVAQFLKGQLSLLD